MVLLRTILLGALLYLAHGAGAEDLPDAPEDFTRFVIPGHEDVADTMNAYLWRHFYQRGGNGVTLFNKEYLTVADLWLNAAKPRGSDKTIQELHRDNLLRAEIGEDGYVYTHQHFSHAHDLGWPFPMWTQSAFDRAGIAGVTAGWHFQHEADLKGWTANYLRSDPIMASWYGEDAVAAWNTEDLESRGIVNAAWELSAQGGGGTLTTPEGVTIDAFNAPFLQLRWTWDTPGLHHALPYLEWQRLGAPDWSDTRRVYLYPEKTPLSQGYFHSILTMHTHPEWKGPITRMRLVFPPGPDTLRLDSFFTVYDTRHTINNPILILASYYYVAFTRDLAFLKAQMPKLRIAMRYMMTELGGLTFNHIRNPWPGHAGRAGWTRDAAGNKIIRPGHGIGNNYWDLMPFGWDDFYSTCQYYAALLKMAELEAAVGAHPGWNIPGGPLALEPEALKAHAKAVFETANKKFWNKDTGRYYASIDRDGKAYDYGYTFLNLEAIWYGIVPEDRARTIMEWIDGRRIVEGDTSTGADIYHWRFGPRATTRRNVEWYGQGWSAPESIPWGGQVQDGGAVLGFSFYDLWARLKVFGPNNAWQRLEAIVAWEQEVQAAGGYRAYYADGRHGTTLQGCGTPGGLGVDCEFYESSLLPSILLYGFMGYEPQLIAKDRSPFRQQAFPKSFTEGMRIENVRIGGIPHLLKRMDGVSILQKAPAVYEASGSTATP